MADRVQIIREVCIADLSEVHRSSMDALTSRRYVPAPKVPLRHEMLYRFEGHIVLLTTSFGQSLVGRLRVTEDSIELWRLIEWIPCRHQLAIEDIVACCIYGTEEAFWDAPTKPQSPSSLQVDGDDDDDVRPRDADDGYDADDDDDDEDDDDVRRVVDVDDDVRRVVDVDDVGDLIRAGIIHKLKSSSDPQLTILD